MAYAGENMFKTMKKLLILSCILSLTMPLYAQNDPTPAQKKATQESKSAPKNKNILTAFLEFINKEAHADIDARSKKKILRKRWKELLKVDIFYPYFKAKEIEDWASDKASIDILDIKGRAKFENDQIKYIFKKSF